MIRETDFRGQKAFVLENEQVRVTVLKGFGAKIASFVYKPKNFEALHQAVLPYVKPSTAEFERFDTAGIDDCFPTIDACTVAVGEQSYLLPDHGEIWYSDVELRAEGETLVASLILKTMPFRFERRMHLEAEQLVLSYKIENLSETRLPYLFALHGLAKLSEGVELRLPAEEFQNVREGEEAVFAKLKPLELDSYPKQSMVKFYASTPLSEARAEVIYPKEQMVLAYEWTLEENPYLGVWVTTGGFKNERNVAVEPCSGFYDSLERALNLKKVCYCEGKSERSWKIALSLSEKRE